MLRARRTDEMLVKGAKHGNGNELPRNLPANQKNLRLAASRGSYVPRVHMIVPAGYGWYTVFVKHGHCAGGAGWTSLPCSSCK